MKAIALILGLLGVLPLLGEERPLFLPFDITLDGQKAVMVDDNELFAQIAEPVKPDAVLKLEKPAKMIIVNAFFCRGDGVVMENQPVVIFASDAQQVKLSDAMNDQKFHPGEYLANVVVDGKTARIVFKVGEKESKIDFSKILGFLKKKEDKE